MMRTGVCVPSGVEAYVIMQHNAGPFAATAAPEMPAVSERIVSRHALCSRSSGPVATVRGAAANAMTTCPDYPLACTAP